MNRDGLIGGQRPNPVAGSAHRVAQRNRVAFDQVRRRTAGVATIVGVNAALRLRDDIVQELRTARVIGVDGIWRTADGVIADRAAAVAIEDGYGQIDITRPVLAPSS